MVLAYIYIFIRGFPYNGAEGAENCVLAYIYISAIFEIIDFGLAYIYIYMYKGIRDAP